MGKEGLMKLSIVHTWVNGSDARLQRAREGAFEETKTEQIPVAGRIGVPNSALRMPGNAARHFMCVQACYLKRLEKLNYHLIGPMMN